MKRRAHNDPAQPLLDLTGAAEATKRIESSDDPDLAPLDRHFARLMLRLNETPSHPLLETAAQTMSARRAAGDICISIEEFGARAEVEAELLATRVVGRPDDVKPLVLDAAGRLYLQRYWAYKQTLAQALRRRIDAAAPALNEERLARDLAAVFGGASSSDPQRRAAETALRRTFCVITGGPGTGKTHTMVKLLLLLQAEAEAAGRPLRVALTAPTGKAAARMKETVHATLPNVAPGADATIAQIASGSRTLHRLLGTIPNSVYFRHNEERPLPVDAVIVDEASMIDLALMAKLVAAVPAQARLILLGDKDQLSSVEAGHVLGELCAPDGSGKLPEHVCELTTNHRFAETSGIYRLSRLVNAGDSEAAVTLLREKRVSDLDASVLPPPAALAGALREPLLAGLGPLRDCTDPEEALARLGQFRILAAVRKGPYGVENLNRLAEQILAREGVIVPERTFYEGRPLLILENDHTLHLFNGDVGVVLRDQEAGGELRAFFPGADGGVRRLLPARLPAHETVFAMTVHKSQGSEFERVLLVLPDRENAVVTRELIYTGITRARSHVELWSREAPLRAAIARRVARAS